MRWTRLRLRKVADVVHGLHGLGIGCNSDEAGAEQSRAAPDQISNGTSVSAAVCRLQGYSTSTLQPGSELRHTRHVRIAAGCDHPEAQHFWSNSPIS